MKKQEYYDPKMNTPYPERTDGHYRDIEGDDGTVFDASYPYVDTSKGFLFKKKLVRILLFLIVFPLTRVRLGLKVEGKKNYKKNKEVLSKGAVMISNHVHTFDYLGILTALKRKDIAVLVLCENVAGDSGSLIRLVGGIPIPEKDYKAMKAFNEAVDGFIQKGGLVQCYAEGSLWEYYRPIRPFKLGAAYFAVNNDKPILPLVYSYRRASWIRRKFFHQPAVFTLHIGEPIFPDHSLEGKECQGDMTVKAHDAMCIMAGIDPKESLYEPIFHNDRRVDYY